MNLRAPVHAAADAGRDLPLHPGERLDQVTAAVACLRDERRRCERLGLEIPLARVESQLRYWSFLEGLFAVADAGSER